jgi:ribonuclease P protein component
MKSPQEDDAPVKLLVSVSKRNFKNAVDRNRIKRIIREAYRKNKHILYNTQNREAKTLLLGLIYTPKSIPDYKELERKIILILQRLNKEDAETTG